MEIMIGIIIVIAVLAIGFYSIKQEAMRANAKAKKYMEYQEALRSGDKAEALKKGRAYYSCVRGGTLSIYDEQAISNDLSTIKTDSTGTNL